MVYDSSYKDLFYLYSGETLDYGLYLGTAPLFYGRAIRRPGDSYIRINVSRICQDSLDAGFPFSGETGLTYGEFSLYRMVDGEPAALLDEYGLLLAFDRDLVFEGDDLMLSEPINGRADSRMKMIYSVFKDMTGETVCEDYRLYKRMTIEPNVLYVGSGATAATLTIISNYDYDITVNGSPDWVTLSQSSGGSGTTILTVSVGANPDYSKRRAIITVDKYQIPLIQAAKVFVPTYIVSPSAITLSAASGTSSITVSANTDYIISQVPSWIHFSSKSGTSGETVFTFTYDETNSFNERGANIRIGNQYVSITQEARYLSVTPQRLVYTFSSETKYVTISANTTWQAAENYDWITVSQYSGMPGETVIGITASLNLGTARSGAVDIGPVRIYVSQAQGEPFVLVNPAYIYATAGGAYGISITSNTSYTITTEADWLTLSASAGTAGISTLSVNVNYDSGVSKTAVIHIGDATVTVLNVADTSGDYLTMRNIGSGNGVLSAQTGSITESQNGANLTLTLDVIYSIDGGEWITLSQATEEQKVVAPDSEVRLKFTSTGQGSSDRVRPARFITLNGTTFELYGNIMSLVAGDSFENASLHTGNTWTREVYAAFANSSCVYAYGTKFPSNTLTKYCFERMFSGCTSLAIAPSLPSMQLGLGCYRYMFEGCTSLTVAPSLPATGLATDCYFGMFKDCTNLTAAPVLPASTVAASSYGSMFSGCTSLTTAPSLPATSINGQSYSYMFAGCTLLTNAPVISATTMSGIHSMWAMFKDCISLVIPPALPATSLATDCYAEMFKGCTSLASAPALPATTLEISCYVEMFEGCTSLAAAPALPAMTAVSGCYNSMFKDCTSLTQAPALPATTLSDDCYRSMFEGCTSLTKSPNLPAATLTGGCYYAMYQNCTSLTDAGAISATAYAKNSCVYMFAGCTSLATAPDIITLSAVTQSCDYMFSGCSSLSYIKCMFMYVSTSNAPNHWVSGVAATGTFVKKDGAAWYQYLPYDSSIPNGWTVVSI